jgi:hypothetical protein
MSEGNCWGGGGGNWSLGDVMINGDYEMDIYKPFCRKLTKEGIIKDFQRCAKEMIPNFECNGELPCFFQQLDQTMQTFFAKSPHLTRSLWKLFYNFVAGNLALRAPLVRFNFGDQNT